MRKLIYGINVTIDGCCDHTKGDPNEQMMNYYTNLIKGVDLFIYGRITYELMVPFWPEIAHDPNARKVDQEYGLAFDAADRVVVSRTLKAVKDSKTTIINDNLAEEILKLKQQPGKDICTGGVDLPFQLIKLGLVDELHIMIHPVIVGEGRRLFEDEQLPESLKFKLIDTETLSTGHVALRYVKE